MRDDRTGSDRRLRTGQVQIGHVAAGLHGQLRADAVGGLPSVCRHARSRDPLVRRSRTAQQRRLSCQCKFLGYKSALLILAAHNIIDCSFLMSYEQCDMYSLGIVLLELLSVFKTDMERHVSIRKLRSERIVPRGLADQWPSLVGHIFIPSNSCASLIIHFGRELSLLFALLSGRTRRRVDRPSCRKPADGSSNFGSIKSSRPVVGFI